MSQDEIRSCGVLIVRGDPVREVLLMIHPTRLDIPKGHVEEGESDLVCALREMEEETGISSEDIELDPSFQFTTKYPVKSKRTGNQWREKTLVVFLGRLKRDVDVQVTEHGGFQWLVWEPPHTLQPETIDPLLAHLAEHLSQSELRANWHAHLLWKQFAGLATVPPLIFAQPLKL